MWTVTGLAIENRLRWVLGHVVADLGLVGAASLENFVQLSQPLCHARLLEAFAILAEVGRAAAMADRRAQHLLVLRIEPGFQGADGVGPAFGAHASPGQAGLVAHASPLCTRSM